jgi:hypothetical protein
MALAVSRISRAPRRSGDRLVSASRSSLDRRSIWTPRSVLNSFRRGCQRSRRGAVSRRRRQSDHRRSGRRTGRGRAVRQGRRHLSRAGRPRGQGCRRPSRRRGGSARVDNTGRSYDGALSTYGHRNDNGSDYYVHDSSQLPFGPDAVGTRKRAREVSVDRKDAPLLLMYGYVLRR